MSRSFTFFSVCIMIPTGCSIYSAHIRPCKSYINRVPSARPNLQTAPITVRIRLYNSYIDDLPTIPHIGYDIKV